MLQGEAKMASNQNRQQLRDLKEVWFRERRLSRVYRFVFRPFLRMHIHISTEEARSL